MLCPATKTKGSLPTSVLAGPVPKLPQCLEVARVSVSMLSSPLAACDRTLCKASIRMSRGGIPAVPRIEKSVLRSTAAGSEIVGPALSPTCTNRVVEMLLRIPFESWQITIFPLADPTGNRAQLENRRRGRRWQTPP